MGVACEDSFAKNKKNTIGKDIVCAVYKGKEVEGRELKLHRLTADKKLRPRVRWPPLSETGQKSKSQRQCMDFLRRAAAKLNQGPSAYQPNGSNALPLGQISSHPTLLLVSALYDPDKLYPSLKSLMVSVDVKHHVYL